MEHSVLASGLFFLIAFFYACVGHAGASGYLAVMAFMNVAPSTIKPTALVLNILVASIATVKFARARAFSKQLFLPLIITSIPCAYLGGLISLPGNIYKPLIGLVLIYAAFQSFYTSNTYDHNETKPIKIPYFLVYGSLLGFLSGISGVGGGIFLSPLLLFLRAEKPKVISGVAAAFILVNSLAGLFGVITAGGEFPTVPPYWVLVVIAGGFLGAEFGSKYLNNPTILKILGLVLVTAGVKMLFAS